MTGRAGTVGAGWRDPARLQQALKLYVVTDERPDGEALLPIVERAIAGGATAVQLRRKQELGRRFVELGRALRELTRRAGVLFFINDRVDVAAIVDADGVHVGQDDISCRDARRLLGPEKVIGVSAETVEEAVAAELDGADYLGVGAVYPTQSKPDAGFTGLDGLTEIVRSVRIPVVAIGGIGLANAGEPMRCGASGIAVVSAVMSAPDPEAAARALRSRVDAERS
ncbi:thiamine phosphate synthase [Alicyclobacillus macrosporangiidus]|uniref:Thiamine-phosphate synthase n=1 Tax=Alicyclobacillus macrosporangiidus TaxID=392015 RepID=A0A1I7GDE3_9BACL|nr:thiamine phosphate synthase [Alicyclobacillus macrosporangiidus]SFU46276.1 thiamine-phosphate pyrophosphorylase [Alicyclobacillus macrosporangiidus]